MHYLVTGGAGFIGSHLCDRLLDSGHTATIIDDLSTGKRENLPPGVQFVEGSICDRGTMQRCLEGVDGCFHLAAIASVERSRREPEVTHAVNAEGTESLFSLVSGLLRPVPVVYASSAAIYGDNPHLPLGEEETPHPLTPYGRDKLANEHTARKSYEDAGVKSVGLRFFNVYGPRQDPASPYSGVISIFARRIAEGEGITFFGDGEQTRDFVYVSDVVSALVAAMTALHDGKVACDFFNVCTGTQTNLKQLGAVLESITGKTVERHLAPSREGDIRFSCGDATRLEKYLGIVASVNIFAGLQRLLNA